MSEEFTLGTWDYCVISVVMMISISIGLFFRFTGSRQKTADDFLMANRNMTRFPVIFSLVATRMSAISLMGGASETFLYGTQRLVGMVYYLVGPFIAAYMFLPVFFAVKSPTIYAYLEHRFGKHTRSIVAFLCFIQNYFYFSIVLYAPALALDEVTSLSLDASVILMGIITTLFSALGGMKAVMWADVFQAFCMFTCLLTVLVFGFWEAGSFTEVYNISQEGGRMDWFNPDLTERYTFWNSLVLGIQPEIVAVCVSQTVMQRAFAIRKLEDAQSAFLWSAIPSLAITVLANTIGLVLFAIFRDCNPLEKESGIELSKADQILPYYILSRMISYPGLAGLCVSGLFCGAISSLSSAVNSMSTIIIDDFIRPMASSKTISRLNFNILAKILVVINGAVITCLPFAFTSKSGILEAASVFNGVLHCPIFGAYLLGLLTETANEKGTFVGVLSGVALSTWISVGKKISGKRDVPTSLSIDGCAHLNFTLYNASQPFTSSRIINDQLEEGLYDEVFPLYRLSFTWTGFIGMITTFIVGYICSFVINSYQVPPAIDSHLLSPITKFWIKRRLEDTEYPLDIKVTRLFDS